IDRPQRDVCEHHDRCRSRAAFDVGFQPLELLGAKIAKTAGFQVDDIDQADEMHAVGVEAVPAGALGALAVAFLVEFLVRIEEIVFAGHVMHIELRLRDDPVGVVELLRRRQVADVAGVDHERRLGRQRVHPGDGLFQRAERVRIGGLVEADMAVADLQERQPLGFLGLRFAHDAERMRNAAGNSPQHAGSDPGHAFQHFAPVDAVVAVEFAHCSVSFMPNRMRPMRLPGTRSGRADVYSRAEMIFMGGTVRALLYRLFCFPPRRARSQREKQCCNLLPQLWHRWRRAPRGWWRRRCSSSWRSPSARPGSPSSRSRISPPRSMANARSRPLPARWSGWARALAGSSWAASPNGLACAGPWSAAR